MGIFPSRSAQTAKFVTVAFVAMLTLLGASSVSAQEDIETYKVTITNLTAGMVVAPPVILTHNVSIRLFQVGKPASEFVAQIAEDSFTNPLRDFLEVNPNVLDVAIPQAPIQPGHSATLFVRASREFPRFSYVGMLAPTNDGFMALDGHILWGGPWRHMMQLPVYDAGTEVNSEDCAWIAAQDPCGNRFSHDPTPDKGYIHIHPGIRGIGDLDPLRFSWLNPTVAVEFVRVKDQ